MNDCILAGAMKIEIFATYYAKPDVYAQRGFGGLQVGACSEAIFEIDFQNDNVLINKAYNKPGATIIRSYRVSPNMCKKDLTILIKALEETKRTAPEGRERYDNLLSWEYDERSKMLDNQKKDVRRERKIKSGIIYILKTEKYYKIGKTTNATNRIKTIAIEMPKKPKLVCKYKTNDIDGDEKYLHNQYESKRSNGEWFQLDNEDLKEIDKYFKKV